jgi:Xaa-Pro aminopeptidase
MLTMHPSIMIGSYGFEPDRLPRDEFQIRMNALHRVMDEKKLAAMLVYGDAREHGAVAWFTNFIPRLRWAMALLPKNGEPRLLTSMSPRDVPAMRQMTWIADVMSGWNWESAFDPWLARLSADAPAAIGTVGFDLMRPALLQSLEKSLGNRFTLTAADPDVLALRSTRPRELSLIREACKVVRAGAVTMRDAWRSGRGNEAAALAGERVARAMAAQDVRTLVSFDGGRTLSPFRGAFELRAEPFLGYIAVKHMGYWAELFVSAGEPSSDSARPAREALTAGLNSVARGLTADKVYANAIAPLAASPLHPVLGGSVGRRVGLSANAGDELGPDRRHALTPGEVYALHVGTRDMQSGAIASAMVLVTSSGCEQLVSSLDL